jgi:protein gp37
MSEITDIQWADTTVNPFMGCGGCELFPSPGIVLEAIDRAVADTGDPIDSRAIYKELINEAYAKILNPKPGHKNAVNTTNIWHLRELFLAQVKRDLGREAEAAAGKAIRQSITCYAATLHLNRGLNLLKPDYQGKKGYSPIFESLTKFEGRSMEAARLNDLLGMTHPETPWKNGLPRLIFVSDMGDALSRKADFPFLKSDLMTAITSDEGTRHIWLWLTKRPGHMAEFAEEIGGFPENVCAMTTLTGSDDESLKRLADLKKVKAHMRGLSIEPLWERIPPAKLNLKGIDWVILGGESGSGMEFTRPFSLEWAEELRDHCRKQCVAFFMKQLGRNPARNGAVFRLADPHGGEWNEWPDKALKIREFPPAFHRYRKAEIEHLSKLRPVRQPKVKKMSGDSEDLTVTPEDKAEFKRQHKIVETGVKAFWQVGQALAVIKTRDLWRAGGHKSWDAYCSSVAGMSRGHAHRLMGAAGFLEIVKTSPRGDVLPIMEAQVRPLLRLPEPEQQVAAWGMAVERAEGSQPTATQVREVVTEIMHPDGEVTKPSSRGQRRGELVLKLKEAVTKRQSWEQVEKLLAELETLI